MNTFDFFLYVLTSIVAGGMAAKQTAAELADLNREIVERGSMETSDYGIKAANECSLIAEEALTLLGKLRGNNKKDVPAILSMVQQRVHGLMDNWTAIKDSMDEVATEAEPEQTIQDMDSETFKREAEALATSMVSKYLSADEFSDEQREESHEKLLVVFDEFYEEYELTKVVVGAVADFETCYNLEAASDDEYGMPKIMLNMRRLRGAVHRHIEAAKQQREAATVINVASDKPEVKVTMDGDNKPETEEKSEAIQAVTMCEAECDGDKERDNVPVNPSWKYMKRQQAVGEVAALIYDRKYATAMAMITYFDMDEDELCEIQEELDADGVEVILDWDEDKQDKHWIGDYFGNKLDTDELSDDELEELAEAEAELEEPEFEDEPELSREDWIIAIRVYKSVYYACMLPSGLDYWSMDKNLAYRFGSVAEMSEFVAGKSEYDNNNWTAYEVEPEQPEQPAQAEIKPNLESATTLGELFTAEPETRALHQRAVMNGVYFADDVPTIRELYKTGKDEAYCVKQIIGKVANLTIYTSNGTHQEMISEVGGHHWYAVALNVLDEPWYQEVALAAARVCNASRKCRAVAAVTSFINKFEKKYPDMWQMYNK